MDCQMVWFMMPVSFSWRRAIFASWYSHFASWLPYLFYKRKDSGFYGAQRTWPFLVSMNFYFCPEVTRKADLIPLSM